MPRMLFLRDIDCDVLVRCRACGHAGTLSHGDLERRFGPNYPVLSIAPQYRCSRCGSRDTECGPAETAPPLAVAAPAPPGADPYESTMAALQGLLGSARSLRDDDDEADEDADDHGGGAPAFAAFATAPLPPPGGDAEEGDPFGQLFDDMEPDGPPAATPAPEAPPDADPDDPDADDWRPVLPAWAFFDGPGSDRASAEPEREEKEPEREAEPDNDAPPRWSAPAAFDLDAAEDADHDADGPDADDDGDWLHRPAFARPPSAAAPPLPPSPAALADADPDAAPAGTPEDDGFPSLDFLDDPEPAGAAPPDLPPPDPGDDTVDEPLDRTLARLLAIARDDPDPDVPGPDLMEEADADAAPDLAVLRDAAGATDASFGPADRSVFGGFGPAAPLSDDDWPDADDDDEPSVEEIAAFVIRDPDEPPPPSPTEEDEPDSEEPDSDDPDDPAPRRWESSFPALRDDPGDGGPGEMESMEQSLAALRGLIEQAAADPEPTPPPPQPKPPDPGSAGAKPALPAKPFIPSREKRGGGGSLDDTLAKLRGLLDLDDDASSPPRR